MIKILVLVHLRLAATESSFSSFSASPNPRPTPANECSVVPPIFTEAKPVEAVIGTFFLYALIVLIMARRRTDLQDPEEACEYRSVPCYPLTNLQNQ